MANRYDEDRNERTRFEERGRSDDRWRESDRDRFRNDNREWDRGDRERGYSSQGSWGAESEYNREGYGSRGRESWRDRDEYRTGGAGSGSGSETRSYGENRRNWDERDRPATEHRWGGSDARWGGEGRGGQNEYGSSSGWSTRGGQGQWERNRASNWSAMDRDWSPGNLNTRGGDAQVFGSTNYGGGGSTMGYSGGMGTYGTGTRDSYSGPSVSGGMGSYAGRHVGRGPKGYRRSDERIREDINERLTDHPDIDASDIEVQVNNGEVTLTGTVEHRHVKRLAEDLAEGVSGVREVHNQLRTIGQGQTQHSTESSYVGASTTGTESTSSNTNTGRGVLTGGNPPSVLNKK